MMRKERVALTELRFRQIHLDFHTSEKIAGIGSKFDPEKFARTLKDAHVNSVTCFSRGHHGMIFHDTKFEHARHPYLERNLLAEQIEACHALDIRVPIYITCGLDELSYRAHPEWCEISPQGQMPGGPLDARYHKLCLNVRGPYIEYVTEQTREVIEMFECDGFFFDIISQHNCVCPRCLGGMLEEGMSPESAEERAKYSKMVLDEFKHHFTKLCKDGHPDATVFHNAGHIYPDWRPILDTYTHLELESLPSGGSGYDHFPITMRYARRLGLDCMGMTGKFHTTWGDFSSFKHKEALEYEVFTMVANGAKCSVGDQLHPTGEICPGTYDLIGPIYGRVEALEPWLAGAEALAEIAIFNPEALGVQDARVDSSAAGAYHMLAETHHQFDYVDTESDLAPYNVLVLADKIPLDDSLAAKVSAFMDGGGKLLTSHESGLNEAGDAFALDHLGVEYVGDAEFQPDFVLVGSEINANCPPVPHVMYDRGVEVKLAGARAIADTFDPYFNRTWEHFCSHQHTPLEGKATRPAVALTDRAAYIAHPVFSMYNQKGARFWKDLAVNTLALLLPCPLVKSNAPSTAQITATRQDKEARTMVHVLHYIPERRSTSIDTIQDVIPLRDVKIALRCDAAPSQVYLAPCGTELDCEFADGYAEVTVPAVEGYAVIVFED